MNVDVTNFRKTFATAAGLVALVLMALSSQSEAQGGCMKGNVMFALSVNGKVELCSQYLEKIPELQKQLDQLQKTASGDQELLCELTRSARSVNALGRNVDANRQVELLQSFSRELQGLIGADQKKTQQQMSQLSDKLDSLQDKITQSKEDRQTAVQTMTALNGKLGDAIARLDLSRAEDLLEDIRRQLNAIGTEVGAVHSDTSDIKKDTSEIRKAMVCTSATAEALPVVAAISSAGSSEPKSTLQAGKWQRPRREHAQIYRRNSGMGEVQSQVLAEQRYRAIPVQNQ